MEQKERNKLDKTKKLKSKKEEAIESKKSQQLAPRPRPRVTLADFEIRHLLGKGAFGEVYLVRHKKRNRWMALKQMDKQLIESAGKQEHVKNEKRVLIKGKSPFLVRMHYSFKTDDCLYLAMEYCPGGDLREFLQAIGTLEENEAQLYFAEMIMAVHTLHSMGYIHRDLKPDNFLIDKDGHLKLADFGLSKSSVDIANVHNLEPEELNKQLEQQRAQSSRYSLLPGQAEQMKADLLSKNYLSQWKQKNPVVRRPSKLTLINYPRPIPTPPFGGDFGEGGVGGGGVGEGGFRLLETPSGLSGVSGNSALAMINKHKRLAYSVVGSPDYMSPEVTSGLNDKSQGYSEEVDWWSLGCVFFEMLLGAPPFTGDSPKEIFDKIQNWRECQRLFSSVW
eukprot:TRINITY_DN1537_c0_g1_i10.p1 TRINITY_DN1537_c0_g1~~TRINITY_DN1537_c0_g1_i10.p1  ORF type:complete len:392 (+),score=107.65 TRINITY_DN1537_c0_g1_i10:534-1709(+)